MSFDLLMPIFRSLQDDTRNQVYLYLAQTGKIFNCQELAAMFSIHPNVMRDHLKTLEHANLIIEERASYKTSKTGRKPMVYKVNPVLSSVISKWNKEVGSLVS